MQSNQHFRECQTTQFAFVVKLSQRGEESQAASFIRARIAKGTTVHGPRRGAVRRSM